VSDERRQFQRLRLDAPLDGWFGDFAIQIVDVSGGGVLVECEDEIDAGARGLLRFFWRGTEVELLAEMTRNVDDGAGLAFIDDASVIRDLIAGSANELLRAQAANADGNRAANVYGDETLTAASSRVSSFFVTWTFADGGWASRMTRVAEQPPNGFTVYAGEPEEQVALLRNTYEGGDTETRRLTRVFAEMSIVNAPKPAQ
jgi:hypothetical protein